ncbi:(2,3-dihydroxybenzoyl)adenylate synthase [Amycolatopsis sp. A1MSW2902]|uniref:(2,3-dihydroxybenzoyl)adenylate synthase n=1 Tax=Amycolatopsis sp. A1MSW2902 TaxID=687413 RepID=UPI00307E7C05
MSDRTDVIAERPSWPAEAAERYRARGYWRGRTFGGRLRDWAADWGSREAVADSRVRLTYGELDAAADRMAGGLRRLGIRRGDRVVVQFPNRADFLVVWFGLVRLGAVPVHAQPGHRASELIHLARTSEAAALVLPERLARFDHRALGEAVRAEAPSVRHVVIAGEPLPGQVPLADVAAGPALPADESADQGDAGDTALLLLSGGTTGAPKLIPRTHDDYAYNADAAAEICGLGPDSVYLAALPIAFNFTMSCPGVLGVLSAGGRVVVAPSGDPGSAFPLIEREGVTITAINPPLAPIWIDEAAAAHDLSTLEIVQIGSARLADDVARRVEPALGARLQQVFGMAEGLLCLTRLDDDNELRCTTQGRPVSPDDEIRVVDGTSGDADRPVTPGEPGELLTRGPYTLRGYYRAAEHNARAFTPDGWYRTGDLVRRLPSGHLVVVGRAKDQINRGGEKIAATEVEGHLLAHPAVGGAALVGAPDPRWGERSVAFLLPRAGTVAPARGDLLAFLQERGVAAYKHPDQVEVLEEFPLTAVGKIDKNVLRARLAER